MSDDIVIMGEKLYCTYCMYCRSKCLMLTILLFPDWFVFTHSSIPSCWCTVLNSLFINLLFFFLYLILSFLPSFFSFLITLSSSFLAMAALYFTVTGIQYWGTTYMLIRLRAPPPLVNALFIICAATGIVFVR